MVLDGFGFGIGLVWIIGTSLLVSSFVLCGATTLVLCGITTLVLCGTITVVLCGHTPPSGVIFSFNWLVWWLGFGLSSGDIFSLWQDREAIFWVEQFLDSFPPLNELILGWVFRINSLSN
jgi:hypothetical protein